MVLLGHHHGTMAIPHPATPHHLHLLMMILTYHPLLLPTLQMDHPEGEGEVEMDEVVIEVEVYQGEGVKLHLEEQWPLVVLIPQGVPR